MVYCMCCVGNVSRGIGAERSTFVDGFGRRRANASGSRPSRYRTASGYPRPSVLGVIFAQAWLGKGRESVWCVSDDERASVVGDQKRFKDRPAGIEWRRCLGPRTTNPSQMISGKGDVMRSLQAEAKANSVRIASTPRSTPHP